MILVLLIICGEKLVNDSMKPSKLKRQQETKHHQTISEIREYFERKKQLAQSKRSTDIRKAFERAGSDLQRATEASFDCSLLIAKAKKLHSIGEQLIKPACLKIMRRLCGPQVVDKVKTIPLSDNTVKDRANLVTSGQDIFMAVDSYLSSNNLPYENPVACCTDGATATISKNKGFNSTPIKQETFYPAVLR